MNHMLIIIIEHIDITSHTFSTVSKHIKLKAEKAAKKKKSWSNLFLWQDSANISMVSSFLYTMSPNIH